MKRDYSNMCPAFSRAICAKKIIILTQFLILFYCTLPCTVGAGDFSERQIQENIPLNSAFLAQLENQPPDLALIKFDINKTMKLYEETPLLESIRGNWLGPMNGIFTENPESASISYNTLCNPSNLKSINTFVVLFNSSCKKYIEVNDEGDIQVDFIDFRDGNRTRVKAHQFQSDQMNFLVKSMMLINLTRVGSFELEGKNRQDIGRAERGEIPSSDIAVETQEIFLDWALARDTLNSINSFYREPIVTYSYIGETEYNPFNCYSLDCYGCHPPPNLSIQFLISKINNATMAFSRCTNNDQTPNFMNWFQCNKFKASINGINITVGEISNISRRVPSNETIIIENPITIQQKNDLSLVLKKYEEQVGWLVPNFNLSNDEIIESHRLLAILSYKDKDIINKIKRDRVSIYIIPIEGDLNKQLAEGLKAAVSEIAKHMSMDESTVKMAFEKSKS